MKAKTSTTTRKRFRTTKNGKILRKHARTGHLKIKQSKKTIRRKRKTTEIKAGMKKKVKSLLPGV